MEGKKKYYVMLLSFVGGILVGILIMWFAQNTKEKNQPPVEEEEVPSLSDVLEEDAVFQALGEPDSSGRQVLESDIAIDDEAVFVKDQEAGAQVFLSRVALTESGWVTIQNDIDGNPGSILGARRFDAGLYQGTVQLLHNTEAGSTYYATLWHDDGDRMFDHTKDIAITTNLLMKFEAF